MKKSLCSQETIPKFVRLNIRSIIHMMLRQPPLWPSRAAIMRGTSDVDWWLMINNALSLILLWISSPISTTAIMQIQSQKLKFHMRFLNNDYCHSQLCSSRRRPWRGATGIRSPRCKSRSSEQTIIKALESISTSSEWVCSTSY